MKKKKEIKKIEYPDNEIYIGEVDSEGVPHGNGKYIFSNGDELIGESWHGYQPEKCTWKFSDGSQFVGEYFSQENKGLGKFTYPNGATYEGEIGTNLKREGEGKFVWPNRQVYIGSWVKNKMQGYGKINYARGAQYEGNFKNDLRHGHGIYIYEDGSKEEGIWDKNELIEEKKIN